MIVFVSGGAKNGKSGFAQDLAVQLANGGKRYYVATMIPVIAGLAAEGTTWVKNIHYVEGIIATGDLFLHKPETKEKIHNRFEAIAGEMEGGSIGQVCFVNKVPFAILRSISDGEGGAMDYATFAEKAADIGIQVVVEFINRF